MNSTQLFLLHKNIQKKHNELSFKKWYNKYESELMEMFDMIEESINNKRLYLIEEEYERYRSFVSFMYDNSSKE